MDSRSPFVRDERQSSSNNGECATTPPITFIKPQTTPLTLGKPLANVPVVPALIMSATMHGNKCAQQIRDLEQMSEQLLEDARNLRPGPGPARVAERNRARSCKGRRP